MINDHRNISATAFDLLKQIERLRLRPYNDQTGKEIKDWVKGATIGYGHLISRQEWLTYDRGISENAALDLLLSDLKPFQDCVKAAINVPLKQREYDALVLLTFNIGTNAFKSSSLVKLVNDPRAVTEYSTLDKAWLAWNRSNDKIMPGLTNRRRAELAIYRDGIYQGW